VSALPPWAGKYVGIPFADKGRTRAGCDCWGLCRLALAEQFGIDLPDYGDAYTEAHDHAGVAAAVQAGLREGWTPLDRDRERPRAGDLLIIKIAARPWHCALMVTEDRFLHCPTVPERGTGRELGTSCIERLDGLIWRRRIEGIYRHEAMREARAA
jgi:cell wall-associated NlpC family hydrolase